ncbi:hypothetical protein QUC31_009062 [Theobroma cacao]|uniref:protein-serine/threonine phosphatase n=1 Tax=Theobroma cacao TaxID=3641 RepID=A0A061G6G5_THECC|nr:Highly ABA-induced PP2C gene 3, putative [Theobroma cacao]WRX17060.1 PPM-type phosphatase-like domain - like 10 [Theobroma cacao]
MKGYKSKRRIGSEVVMDVDVTKKKRGIKKFTQRSEKEQEKREENKVESVTCVSHGSISVIGRRRAMEDAVKVSVGEIQGYDFFAVYDGHGGAQVANACRDRMHQLVVKEVEERTRGGKGPEWEKVMAACFAKMDEEVSGEDYQGGAGDVDMKTMGSTAVVVLVGRDVVVVANCGDSRAVLCRGGTAVALSSDHKPDRPDERERVEAAGGTVINWNGSRVLGVLATSRSIGDQHLKPYVISKPEVSVTERTKSDNFLVLASDGLWDVVSSEIACEVVKRHLDGRIKMRFSDDPQGCTGDRAAEAAAMLAELAVARGSTDNISVIVVELKR